MKKSFGVNGVLDKILKVNLVVLLKQVLRVILFRVVFNNMRTLKFNQWFTFFAAINHLSSRLSKFVDCDW